MKCPYCGHLDSKVLDSRPAEEGEAVRRRRHCEGCGRRFTTYETVEAIPLLVRKKDDNREAYDRAKLRAGILRACHKRPVAIERLDALVDSVETVLFARGEKEIDSVQIGELVMEGLREIDPVAYVRFASVYRQFTDIHNFMEELSVFSKKD